MNSVFKDKRMDERYPAHKASILMQDDKQIYTTIINFSASGIGFLCAVELQAGNLVELVFDVDIDDQMISFRLPIEVVRSHQDEDEHVIGAKLQKVTFEYRQLLKKLADMYTTLGTIKSHDPNYPSSF
ncbi:PilZ domain-containing protein [Thiomicrorhabdus sp. ZW0627]|uniref:PilZ domain-containing protein n=1 Tax=Thiomicrorhabdus sp. ZW0627 TaxID=3039774 RepID=UPI0024371488|nr:PilZ domain-containing protein [Thiomicrorhabdus sp. ZW0627]MDG6774569.1 PilZ domain-containing protein [Thiomicrorhabdus sp. ZW0627]